MNRKELIFRHSFEHRGSSEVFPVILFLRGFHHNTMKVPVSFRCPVRKKSNGNISCVITQLCRNIKQQNTSRQHSSIQNAVVSGTMSSKKRKVIDLVEDSETESLVKDEDDSETENLDMDKVENRGKKEDTHETETRVKEEYGSETESQIDRLENMKKHFNRILNVMDELMSEAACPEKSLTLIKALQNEAKELRKANGPTGEGTEEDDSSDDDEDDESRIDSTMNELDRNWAHNCLQLRHYLIEHGNSNVPTLFHENKTLGRWVTNQRHLRRVGKLSQERIDKLDRLYFTWGKSMPRTASWNEMYQRLVDYWKEHENCNVPFNEKRPSALTKWMAYQRMEYKLWKKGRGTPLTPAKILKLNEINFNWKGPKM